MDVRFCEGRNHRREARVRAAGSARVRRCALPRSALQENLFLLDKDLHGCRQLLPWDYLLFARQPPEALHGAGISPARKTRASMQRSWELCALDIKALDQAVFDSKHVTDHLIR